MLHLARAPAQVEQLLQDLQAAASSNHISLVGMSYLCVTSVRVGHKLHVISCSLSGEQALYVTEIEACVPSCLAADEN